MITRPFIIIKTKAENLRIQQIHHRNTFFNQVCHFFHEKLRGDVVILVLHDVVHYQIHALDLVVTQCCDDGGAVVKVVPLLLWDLVFVDYRVLRVEVVFVFIRQERFHRA